MSSFLSLLMASHLSLIGDPNLILHHCRLMVKTKYQLYEKSIHSKVHVTDFFLTMYAPSHVHKNLLSGGLTRTRITEDSSQQTTHYLVKS
ncbi:hypothetical protein V6Z12_A05G107200 [Gossypium hirsutum]